MRTAELAGAAIFRLVESVACAFTRYDFAAGGPDLQFLRARPVEVPETLDLAAIPGSAGREDGYGDVEAVDEADVVEVRGGQGELRQRDRGFARA